MKKIVFITDCLTEGVGKHVIDLYCNLSKRNDYDIYVLYGNERVDERIVKKIDDNKKYLIESFKRKIGFNDLKSIKEIKRILIDIKPDVVHCHSSKAGLCGRYAAKRLRVKNIIYSPHAYFFLKYKNKSLKQKIFLFAEKILSKLFTNITIATSKGEYEAYKKYKIDKISKCVLIEHGLVEPNITEDNRKNERLKLKIRNNEILVGAMARFEYQKNPINTFKILDEISKKRKHVKCIFWGDGKMYEEVKTLAKTANSSVLLPGKTENPDLSLKCLDIYLTASLYEGLPYTLLESLALKLPIVASNVVGNSDCVIDSQNGYLFAVDDCEEAVEKILKIIDKKEFNSLSQKSYTLFQKKYSIQVMINKYIELYGGNNG